MTTYNLNIRAQYLAMILDGRKTVEVRVQYPRFRELAAGDVIRFNGEHEYRVTRVERYPDFPALVAGEDARAIGVGDADALLAALRDIYPPDKEALGGLAIHLAPT